MRIAVLSDSHDQMENMLRALDLLREAGISCGIHLGDFCLPETLQVLADSGIRWTGVWGNNDRDRTPLGLDIEPQDTRELQLDRRSVFITHYPPIARIAALGGTYDAVFHGHNHQAKQELVGRTLLVNPGEIIGRRFGKPSFGIYTTHNNQFEFVRLRK